MTPEPAKFRDIPFGEPGWTPEVQRRNNEAREECACNAEYIGDYEKMIAGAERGLLEMQKSLVKWRVSLSELRATRALKQASGEWPQDADVLAAYSRAEQAKALRKLADDLDGLPTTRSDDAEKYAADDTH